MFGISLFVVFFLYFSSLFAQTCFFHFNETNLNPTFAENIVKNEDIAKLLSVKKCLSDLENCVLGIQLEDVVKANASCLSFGTNITYQLTSRSSSWNDTQEECQVMGGNLATVGLRSCTSRKLIISFAQSLNLPKKELWFGLSKVDKSWQWLDGVREADDSSFWLKNEPNNRGGDENCATLLVSPGKVNDLSCKRLRFGLCELKKTGC